jgi:glycosyltransferase involved in cell wall biosynthesis
MHPILTIAIPTYNRREELLRTVAALIPGLNGKVRVVILDNHSDYGGVFLLSEPGESGLRTERAAVF